MTKLTSEQKLEGLLKKQNAIKNRISSITSRIRNEQDKRLTRKKILVGAYFLEKYKEEPNRLNEMLNGFLARDNDRLLFGLQPKSKIDTENIKKL